MPPALTAEQTSQNEAGHYILGWCYSWNEAGQSWDLTDNKLKVCGMQKKVYFLTGFPRSGNTLLAKF